MNSNVVQNNWRFLLAVNVLTLMFSIVYLNITCTLLLLFLTNILFSENGRQKIDRVYHKLVFGRYSIRELHNDIQWDLDLTKGQGTGQICSV